MARAKSRIGRVLDAAAGVARRLDDKAEDATEAGRGLAERAMNFIEHMGAAIERSQDARDAIADVADDVKAAVRGRRRRRSRSSRTGRR
jgi:hypothetical protein